MESEIAVKTEPVWLVENDTVAEGDTDTIKTELASIDIALIKLESDRDALDAAGKTSKPVAIVFPAIKKEMVNGDTPSTEQGSQQNDDSQNMEISTVPINIDDGEWEVLQDVRRLSEPIVPSQNTPSTVGVTRNIRKRKRTSERVEEENELLNRANNILNSMTKKPAVKSELEVFGTFVTASLQDMKSKALVLRTKHDILNIIMKAQEEELKQNLSM